MDGCRVLVLGASGFLGQAVSSAVESDPRVRTVVRSGGRIRAESAGAWVTHDLVGGTVEDLVALLGSVQPDVVLNCVGRLEGDGPDLVAANTLVVARLIEAVERAAPAARLVTVGSAAEYGVVEQGEAVRETHPTRPVGVYGVTKLAATQLVQLAARQNRVDAVSLRVFNPVGAGMPAESVLGRAETRIREALAAGSQVIHLGPLGAYRDFVDVRDVAVAMTAVGLADTITEPVLNVGSGSAVLVRDAVQQLAAIAGFDGRIAESAPAPSRSASVDWIAADLTLIRASVDWSPSVDLESSLKAIWLR
jgi:nucleoside-diphosphate-sugar epimerase